MNPAFADLAQKYRTALLDDILPFWERHSVDRVAGGYLTCLARDGAAFDTDKFVWLQARQIWTFSMLYDRCEKRESWLHLAGHGAEFLRRRGRDPEGDWYFSLARDGRPLVQPCNIFSDCFAAMAFGRLALITGDDGARAIADRTYHNILRRRAHPKGRHDKAVPGARPMITMAIPMILANVTMELEPLLGGSTVEASISACLRDLFTLFFDEPSQMLREYVSPDGAKLDSFEGRLINPGHVVEAMWFVMDIAERRNDRALIEKAVAVTLHALETGWDNQFGGIFYFLDAHGHPPQQLEWDQKLWWVHVEALVALLKGFHLTGRKACWDWFERVHAYVWSHFPDREFGEWYGYLNRRGEVLLSLKGGKWKGCFHIPRGLYLCMRELEKLDARQTDSLEMRRHFPSQA